MHTLSNSIRNPLHSRAPKREPEALQPSSEIQQLSIMNHPERAAIQEEDLLQMHAMVANGVDDERWEDYLKVPLEQAMMAQNVRLFNILLDAGAYLGDDILHRAVSEAMPEFVDILLARGADRDETCIHRGKTPLMYAIEANSPVHTGLATKLLEAGALVDTRDEEDISALDLAVRAANISLVRDIAARVTNIDQHGFEGKTALHLAALWESVAAVDALIEAGASIEKRTPYGDTPLMTASQGGFPEIIRAFLRHGADVNATGDGGCTPLHMVCLLKIEGVYEAVDALLRSGADETALSDDGQTPESEMDNGIVGMENEATDDEINRTRLLLSRAPRDRAWRRRGWLAVLRARETNRLRSEEEEEEEDALLLWLLASADDAIFRTAVGFL